MTKHGRRYHPGFTLIELLTVIGIIVILLTILLPVIQSVRKKSWFTDTGAEMNSIATACQNYFLDYNAYPGPIAESQIYGYNFTAPTVTPAIPAVSGSAPTKITASENLVLGICGGLVLNKSTGAVNYDPTQVVVGPQNLTPVNPRTAVGYYNPKPSELSSRGTGYVSQASYNPGSAFIIPELLDHYPVPGVIVYLRANRGARNMVDSDYVSYGAASPYTPTVKSYGATVTSQYYSMEMAPYWVGGTVSAGPPVKNIPSVSGSVFPCQGDPYNGYKQLYPGTAPTTAGTPGASDLTGTILFFQNPSLTDGTTPRCKDSFILMSSGNDGIFGTGDDQIYAQ